MAMMRILESSLAIVGPGRAGKAFARSWLGAGGRIAAVIARRSGSESGIQGVPVAGAQDPSFPPVDVLVLAVPDDAIEAVATRLSDRLTCRYAFHLSGALPAGALAALYARGARIGSLHPVRPFTGLDDEDWSGAFVAVEGDAEAIAVGERIATAVGARPHVLKAANKPLYHACASLAAGGSVAVLSVAVRGWAEAGIPESVAQEALAALASRATAAAADRPFAEALTGAVARRDLGTIRAHLAALAGHPDALGLYRALGKEILARTAARGREEETRDLLEGRRDSSVPTTGSS